jgi:predicted PurR-regulated permease PerM
LASAQALSLDAMTATTGPSVRAIAKVFTVVAVLAALLYFAYLIRQVLGLVFIGGFLAIALGPPVGFVNRRGVPRVVSILVVYLLIAASIFGIGLLVVPPAVRQIDGLARDIPHYLNDLRKNRTFRRYDQRYKITPKLNEQARKLPSKLGAAAGALRSVTVGVFTAVVQLVTVLTITFFLLLDGGRLLRFVIGLAGPVRAERLQTVASDIYTAVSGYVAGNLIISVIAGLTTYVTLAALGVPFAVPLSVLMAFLDLIPLVGATLGGVTIGIVTLFHSFPTATIVWAIVLIVYQQVENNLIQPVVYRRTVAIHPLLVIISILIGGTLAGVLGALVALPVAAALQIVARDLWSYRRAPPPTQPAAPAA